MKRLICTVLIAAMLPSLSACGSVYTNYREMEQLLVLQTMGLDRAAEGGITLSLASSAASGRRKSPVRMKLTGATIASAVERAQNYSFEESLFFSHMDALILGEDYARQWLVDCVDFVTQSPRLRVDIPIYIVKGATAEKAVLEVGDDTAGISEILRGVSEFYDTRGGGSVYTLSDFTRDTLRHGSALVCALELTPAAQTASADTNAADTPAADTDNDAGTGTENADDSAPADTVAESESDTPRLTAAGAGYAVMQDMKLAGYIDSEDALGISFLKNTVRQTDVTVQDARGNAVTLEINQGGCDITPRFTTDRALSRIDISARVGATVLEADGTASFSDSAYMDYLTGELESLVSEKISGILRLARSLQADFIGLGAAVEQASPEAWAKLERPFYELLPALEVRISVTGQITHSNDTRRTVYTHE